jgi:hypothetical protein
MIIYCALIICTLLLLTGYVNDSLYYLVKHSELTFGLTQRGEFWWDDSAVWNTIGTNLRFTPQILSISNELLRKYLGVAEEAEKIPPFISVHIRRTDFKGWCANTPREECLAPLAAYVKRVQEVKTELMKTHPDLRGVERLEDIKVILLTDEPRITAEWLHLPPGTSEAWWVEADTLGWISIRHDLEKTSEKYGQWSAFLPFILRRLLF